MQPIYYIDENKRIFLYHWKHYILLRVAKGDTFERSILLSNDYASDLNSLIFQSTLYYTYLTKANDIQIKSTLEPKSLFSISANNRPDCYGPTLFTLENVLYLAFFIKNPLDDSYYLKCVQPTFSTNSDADISNACDSFFAQIPQFTNLPKLYFFQNESASLLFCQTKTTAYLFQYDNQVRCYVPFVSYKSTSDTKHMETLTKQIETLTAQNLDICAQNETLTAQNLDICAQNATLAEQNQTLTEQLSAKNSLIEHIKAQYDTLMQTAQQYKSEAEKWYDSYMHQKF